MAKKTKEELAMGRFDRQPEYVKEAIIKVFGSAENAFSRGGMVISRGVLSVIVPDTAPSFMVGSIWRPAIPDHSK